jgi:hypothetical protein
MLCNWLSACVTAFGKFGIVFLATPNYKIVHFRSSAPLIDVQNSNIISRTNEYKVIFWLYRCFTIWTQTCKSIYRHFDIAHAQFLKYEQNMEIPIFPDK